MFIALSARLGLLKASERGAGVSKSEIARRVWIGRRSAEFWQPVPLESRSAQFLHACRKLT